MTKGTFFQFFAVVFLSLFSINASAQEFPIATGSDITWGGGGASDGTNMLLAIMGDASSQYSITCQLISPTGTLIGSRISLGATGSSPMVAYDGTRYLVAWTDTASMLGGSNTYATGDVRGQFLTTAGALAGSPFTIATGVNIKWGKGRGGLIFRDTTYLVTFVKGGNHVDYLYGQRIRRSGALLGSPVQISTGYAREHAIAFDGTNYLVAWCKMDYPSPDKDIYGQFVSPSGALVGANFLIDGGPYGSDNPVTLTFDNGRYLVGFHEQEATGSRWNMIGRFVSTAGTPAERFLICDSTKSPTYATGAFDGTHYLITWMEQAGSVRVMGRFFSPTGVPAAAAFVAFDTLGGKFPWGGVGGFLNGRYFLTATRINTQILDADIYGRFLLPLATGVENEGAGRISGAYSLSQNYPNPFNPSTVIRYGIPEQSHVVLAVFNALGQEVARLVQAEQAAGVHEVRFDALRLPSGVYYYRMQAGDFTQTNRLTLIR
jgi:hypothetical protein